jgi:ring-1,2-phenylacetyl-CoA epoxidase subunit PaaD
MPPSLSTTDAHGRAWEILNTVLDPELPALSVVDLGIVRVVDESADGRRVTVTLTPTYSGCPATEVIARDVRTALESAYDEVVIETVLSPAWTTDWMTDAGREKLHAFGIVPPSGLTNVIHLGPTIGHRDQNHPDVDHVRSEGRPEACPRCGSGEVEELAGFGSTPCKALWRCTACREPFDYFKKH